MQKDFKNEKKSFFYFIIKNFFHSKKKKYYKKKFKNYEEKIYFESFLFSDPSNSSSFFTKKELNIEEKSKKESEEVSSSPSPSPSQMIEVVRGSTAKSPSPSTPLIHFTGANALSSPPLRRGKGASPFAEQKTQADGQSPGIADRQSPFCFAKCVADRQSPGDSLREEAKPSPNSGKLKQSYPSMHQPGQSPGVLLRVADRQSPGGEGSEESVSFSTNFQNSLQKRLQTKIVQLAKHYNEESIEAVTNFFADILSFATLWFLLVRLEIQINITKSFLLEVFFGLDDSKKSLLILFLTDLLVGYHSPNIWELFFQTLFDHYGLPESQTTIFLLVATLPVLLDVLFKYLIFRHLNRASPATVATYHAMIE